MRLLTPSELIPVMYKTFRPFDLAWLVVREGATHYLMLYPLGPTS